VKPCALLAILALCGCVGDDGPRDAGVTTQPIVCRTADRTCSPDGRVCSVWCDKVEIDADEPEPEITACGGRDGCSAVCR